MLAGTNCFASLPRFFVDQMVKAFLVIIWRPFSVTHFVPTLHGSYTAGFAGCIYYSVCFGTLRCCWSSWNNHYCWQPDTRANNPPYSLMQWPKWTKPCSRPKEPLGEQLSCAGLSWLPTKRHLLAWHLPPAWRSTTCLGVIQICGKWVNAAIIQTDGHNSELIRGCTRTYLLTAVRPTGTVKRVCQFWAFMLLAKDMPCC